MGLFALHTMTDHDAMSAGSTSADVSHTAPDSTTTDPASISPAAVIPIEAATSIAAATASALPLVQKLSMADSQGCPGCAMQCAIYAMNCVILIVLSLLVLLARFPLTGSAASAAKPLLPVQRAARRRLLRPSLIALSISRT